MFAWQWKMWLSALLNSEHSQKLWQTSRCASLSPWVVSYYSWYGGGAGTLVECKAALCLFYPVLRLQEFTLLLYSYSVTCLSLLTVTLDSHPSLPSIYRSPWHARSWQMIPHLHPTPSNLYSTAINQSEPSKSKYIDSECGPDGLSLSKVFNVAHLWYITQLRELYFF